MSDAGASDLEVKIIYKMASNGVTGAHNRTIEHIASNWGFASHNEGKVKELLEELATDPEAPVEKYGGHRNAVRLTDMQEAKSFIKENGGELPWGLRE
jgi:hypothetical protein